MLTIQRGPIPPVRTDKRPRKYPFARLEVGEMFFVPDRPRNNMMGLVSQTGKKLKRQFGTRHCYMKFINDKWVTCEPNDEGANLGICVFRFV